MSWGKLLLDNDIQIADETDGHYRDGWTNIQCPFCDDSGFHMGLPEGGFMGNCYRCGKHLIMDVLCELLEIPKREAYALVQENVDGDFERTSFKHISETENDTRREMPEIKPLHESHRPYLETRDFDPDMLVRDWGIGSYGLYSGKYACRIAVPVNVHGKTVTWQAMSPVRPCKNKYIFPNTRMEKSVDPHTVLYGFDHAVGNSHVYVAEGVTDVWRLGYGAVATFGVNWTDTQLNILLDNWDVFVVCIDNDGNEDTLQTLADGLLLRGKDVFVLDPTPFKDVAEMPLSQVAEYKADIERAIIS